MTAPARHWTQDVEERAEELARSRLHDDLRARRADLIARRKRVRARGDLGRKLGREIADLTRRILAVETGRSS